MSIKRILHVVKQQVTPVRDSTRFGASSKGNRHDLVEAVPQGESHAVRVQRAVRYREIHPPLGQAFWRSVFALGLSAREIGVLAEYY